ncbi:hypothetical protein M0M43_08150 [Pimelobacter simplex]|nr:hypothetical protein [Pimelobacter simplex]UUW91446.1 hypothetical protein M0M43_08150 [Pimelobacter simplex]UUW95274.1 hypothetical protein M0M48_26655 [Pimelobacter simplex]
MARATGEHLGAGLDRRGDVALDLAGQDLVVERSHRGGLVEGQADHDPVAHLLGEARGELVVDRVVDQEPAGRDARLPRGAVRRGDGVGHDLVEVRVVEHDERSVAAELDELGLAGRTGRDPLSGRDGAGEGDHLDVGVPGEGVADDGAGSGHQVHDARREAGGLEALDPLVLDQRGRGRGERHDRVAGDERGRELAGRGAEGEVPGLDRRDHAPRHPVGVRAAVRVGEGDDAAAVEVLGDLDRDPEVVGRLVDLGERLEVVGLALLEREQPAELLAAPGDLGDQALDVRATLEDAQRGPVREGPAGGGDRAVDVLGGAEREAADRLAGRRTDGLLPLGPGRIDEPAVDERARVDAGD